MNQPQVISLVRNGRRVVSSGEHLATPLQLLGGKGANLQRLEQLGFTVPPWLCVTTVVFSDLMVTLGPSFEKAFADLDFGDRDAVRNASREIQQRIQEIALPILVSEQLLQQFDAQFGSGVFVAVRSSGTTEDSSKDSFAGQMDSYLFVTRASLLDRVCACFASVYSERAMIYRRTRGQDLGRIDMAVLVQQMIDSRASGILFTANPTSGNLTETVVCAGLGLGEGIVGGIVETDTFTVDQKSGRIIDRQLTEKRTRVSFDSARGSGTIVSQVEPPISSGTPVLSDEEIIELAAIGRRARQAFGSPQDMEWAIDQRGRIHLLQTRPITTLAMGRETIFDNSNIVENYPGISLPLTFSIMRATYEGALREGSRIQGMPKKTLTEEPFLHASLLGLIDGRIYYNLSNWYRRFDDLPGGAKRVAAMERALGFTARTSRQALNRRLPRFVGMLMLVRALYLRTKHFVLLNHRIGQLKLALQSAQADLRTRGLDQMEALDLIDHCDRLLARFLSRFALSPINDSFVQKFYQRLNQCIARWKLDDKGSLSNDLLCGVSGMESVEPVHSMVSIAESISRIPRLRALFDVETRDSVIWEALQSHGEFVEVRDRVLKHLELYGDRMLSELKLETPPLEDNPTFLVNMIRNYLRGNRTVAEMERSEDLICKQAEAKVYAKLRFSPFRLAAFTLLLSQCREKLKNREALRLARTRLFGMVRRILRQLGVIFEQGSLLDDRADLFYLTYEELSGFIRGGAVTRNLRALVNLRKEEYRSFQDRRPAPRIVTRGIAYANRFPLAEMRASHSSGEVLKGIGCSRGNVRAPAKVILSPDQNLRIQGEILVAPSTDPGWVFLMVAAGGLISEKGNILSHTAIIGRELGIPTVIGVKDVTAIIKSGDVIDLDGEAGTIRIVERSNQSDDACSPT